MEVTMDELKIQPDEIISHIGQGYDISVIYNGKIYAKIVPISNDNAIIESDDSMNELFGLWKDRSEMNDVAQYVRKMRQGRKL
jgi:antitoxin (DNA-binding transcriptional repressor) of toxin-antitoxin stability system